VSGWQVSVGFEQPGGQFFLLLALDSKVQVLALVYWADMSDSESRKHL